MTMSARIASLILFATLLATACDEESPVEVVDPCTVRPCSEDAVIDQLERAYATLDPTLFEAVLHPDFLFILRPDPSNPGQPTDWGRAEEARIHRRMFRPQEIPASEDPVPKSYWLDAVEISLTTSSSWVERPEYYSSPSNPDGLDSLLVKVSGIECDHSVLFRMLGDTDFQTTGQSYFIVVADRARQPDEPGAFALYRWQDLGSNNRSREGSWSGIKGLYRS